MMRSTLEVPSSCTKVKTRVDNYQQQVLQMCVGPPTMKCDRTFTAPVEGSTSGLQQCTTRTIRYVTSIGGTKPSRGPIPTSYWTITHSLMTTPIRTEDAIPLSTHYRIVFAIPPRFGSNACYWFNCFQQYRKGQGNIVRENGSICSVRYRHLHRLDALPLYSKHCREYWVTICFDHSNIIVLESKSY